MFGKYLYLLVKRLFQPHCRSFFIDSNAWYIMVCWAPKAPSISINLSFALSCLGTQHLTGTQGPILENCHSIWLVVYLPLWKICSSVGMMKFPIWKSKTCSRPPTSYFWPPIPRSTDSCRSCSWIATEEQHHQKDGRDQNDLRFRSQESFV